MKTSTDTEKTVHQDQVQVWKHTLEGTTLVKPDCSLTLSVSFLSKQVKCSRLGIRKLLSNLSCVYFFFW